MVLKSFDEIIDHVKRGPTKTIAVAMAEDDDVLSALNRAYDAGIADAVLIGNQKEIESRASRLAIDIAKFDIINELEEKYCVVRAIQLVREGLSNTLMKGKCSTSILLKGVLDKDHGLEACSLLSHLAVFQVPTYRKFIFMSDGGMNIAPNLKEKVAITENAIAAAIQLGITEPKVALIAAVEKVNPDAMPCTRDAAIISKMGQREQIKGAIIDGPLAIDNAIDPYACEVKGIKGSVCGDADILIMPNIETGNCFYKTMAYLADSKTAGVIVGANVPIILTSRADSDETKFLSITLAICLSHRH